MMWCVQLRLVTTRTRSGRESKMPGKYADYVWRGQHAIPAAILPPSVILWRFQSQAHWPDIPSRVCWADDKLSSTTLSLFWQQWYWTDVPLIAPAVRHQRHLAATVERGIPFLLFTCHLSILILFYSFISICLFIYPFLSFLWMFLWTYRSFFSFVIFCLLIVLV